MTPVPDRSTFEAMYAGQAPWDIGRPQKPFIDVADQITQQSNLHPVGRTEGQPFAFQIIVNNQPETIRQIEEMVISARKDQPLRVKDVASVRVVRVHRRAGFRAVDARVDTAAPVRDRHQRRRPATRAAAIVVGGNDEGHGRKVGCRVHRPGPEVGDDEDERRIARIDVDDESDRAPEDGRRHRGQDYWRASGNSSNAASRVVTPRRL